MSEQFDALKAQIDTLNTKLDNIKGDIDVIKNGLPPSGGLSADEVAALRTALGDTVAKATALDDENPPASA